MIPRYLRRQAEKAKKRGENCLICPNCGDVRFGQPAARVITVGEDVKQNVRQMATCTECGTNMVKRSLKE